MGNASLFHSHFMMDAGKYADDNSWNVIKIDLKKRWKGNYRVEADRLYDTKRQSLGKTFEKTSSYSFKKRLKFDYQFGNYKWEDNLEDEYDLSEKENYFSNIQASTIFNIYKAISRKNNFGLILGWESKL